HGSRGVSSAAERERIGERWEATQPSSSPAPYPLGPLAYRFSRCRPLGGLDGQAAPRSVDPDLLGLEPDVEAARVDQHVSKDVIGLLAEAQALEQQGVTALRLETDEHVRQLFVLVQRFLVSP